MSTKPKFVEERPFANPEAAAQVLLEIASGIEPSVEGRIYIERLNDSFLGEFGGSVSEYRAGLELAINNGWLELHESGTFVRITKVGSEIVGGEGDVIFD
jgi:hypothetical protein